MNLFNAARRFLSGHMGQHRIVAYKVFRYLLEEQTWGPLFLQADVHEEGWYQTYQVGKVAHPYGESAFSAFVSQEYAQTYVDTTLTNRMPYGIFEVTIPEMLYPPTYIPEEECTVEDMQHYWSLYNQYADALDADQADPSIMEQIQASYPAYAPPGTIFVPSFTMVQAVHYSPWLESMLSQQED